MNGRAYDYNLGRFLSVDPFIQEPGNSQSMNPYSYIMNNPLAGTDPSGYRSICKTNVMCDTIWVNGSGTLHLGTIEDKNGKIRNVAIKTKTNVKTEDIGSTPARDIESITISGKDEISHFQFRNISGGTFETKGRPAPKPNLEMKAVGKPKVTLDNIFAAIRTSEIGGLLLDALNPKVKLDRQKGASFDPNTGTIHLNPNQAFRAVVADFAHELGHLDNQDLGVYQGSVSDIDVKQDYINERLTGEAWASLTRDIIYEEMVVNHPTLMQKSGHYNLYNSLNLKTEADKVNNLRYLYSNYRTSTTGETYQKYYGDYWDEVHGVK